MHRENGDVQEIHYFEWIDGRRAIRFTRYDPQVFDSRDQTESTEFRPTAVHGVLSACYRSPGAKEAKVAYRLSSDGTTARSDLLATYEFRTLTALRMSPAGLYQYQSQFEFRGSQPNLKDFSEIGVLSEVKAADLAAAEENIERFRASLPGRVAEQRRQFEEQQARKRARQREKDQAFWNNMNLVSSGLAAATAQTSREYANQQAESRARNERIERAAAGSAMAAPSRPADLATRPSESKPKPSSMPAAPVATTMLTESPAVRDPRGSVNAKPSGTAAAAKPSTNDDPNLCVSQPQITVEPQGCYPHPKTNATLTNSCAQAVEARLCLKKTDGRWDCMMGTMSPSARWGGYTCSGSGQFFIDTRSAGSKRRLADPPGM